MIIGQDEIKSLLQVAVDDDLPTLLVGETGTGKTSLIRELADQNGQTYTRFSITGETTVDDFVGKYILKDGETKWQDGILLTAAKKGHYLVVDEINAALPEILFVLHSLLDDDKYIIVPQKDNSLVKPAKNFRFFATMNPVDEYAGTKELNKAFHSRFAMVIEVRYPKPKVEVQILMDRTGVEQTDAEKMVDVALGVRKAKRAEQLFYTLSTRDLIYWGMLHGKLGVHRAFTVAIRNKGGEDGNNIEKIYSKVFTDWKKAEEDKLPTNIEWYQREHTKIDGMKKNIRSEVEKDVRADLQTQQDVIDQEKKILQTMEDRIKDKLKQSLKAAA